MNIAILSRLNSKGGSEFRCADTANIISQQSDHKVTLIGVSGINKQIITRTDPQVSIIREIKQSSLRGIDVVLVGCSHFEKITRDSLRKNQN